MDAQNMIMVMISQFELLPVRQRTNVSKTMQWDTLV